MLNKAILGSRPTFRITVSAGSGGTASVNKQYAAEGETVTISISPYSNYVIGSVSVPGVSVSGSGYTRTFVMPSNAVTVSVSFSYVAPSYSISISAGTGGTASLSTYSATAGTRVYIYVSPSTGYEVASVSASGVSVSGSGTTYYFTMPSRSVTVSVSFKQMDRYVWAVSADKDYETPRMYLLKIPEAEFNAAQNTSRYSLSRYTYALLPTENNGKIPYPYYNVKGNLLIKEDKGRITYAITADDCADYSYQTVGVMKEYWHKSYGNPVAMS